jgi:tetratricopeptide (TPR) repeat protein
MSLNKYDPRLKKYEELVETFVCGEKILKELLEDITPGKNNELTNQSWIITGQRGSGKSHLVSLFYQEILRNKTINERWLPLIFPEELFMVDSLYRLLIEILNKYFSHIPNDQNIKQLHLEFLELKRKRLPDNVKQKFESKHKIAKELFGILIDLKQKTGKKIILILENIQYLFREQLSEDDLKHLRSFFHENQDVFIIIGTATTIFDQVENTAKPFYHFFRMRQMDSLEQDEILNFLTKIASYRNDSGIQLKINDNRSYIYTYNILTGGNPRLILFIYEILLDNEYLNTELILEKIAELTPYFLDKIKGESEQRRILLDAFASGSPVFTAKEISEITNADLKLISAQIKILEEEGWIKEIPMEGNKIKKSETFFAIKDYFYRIWYRLRMGEIYESEIYCMAELVSLLFDQSEIESRMNKYASKNCANKLIYENAFNLINDERFIENIKQIKESFKDNIYINMNIELPKIKAEPKYEMIEQKSGSNDLEIFKKTAIEFYSKQDYKNAIFYFDKVLEIKKDDYFSWYKKGMIHSFLQEYNKTIECYKKVLDIKPDYFRIRNQLGLAYLHENKYQLAIECLEIELKEKKRDFYTFYLLGIAYYQLNNYKEAIKYFQEGLKPFPDKYEAWLSMGQSYFQQHNFIKALECFDKAIKIAPRNFDAWNGKGITYLGMHDYQRAIESFKEAISINPSSTRAWYNMGNAFSKLTEYRKSIECYTKVVKKQPDLFEAWYYLAEAYFEMNENFKALDCYKQALRINPGDINILGNLGDMYLKLSEYETALEYFQSVLDIDPDNVLALKKMGVLYYIIQSYDKSIEYFEKAREINPNDDITYDLLGSTYQCMDNHKKAIECFEETLKIKPDNYSAWLQLSKSQYNLNDYENSYQSFSNFILYANDFRSNDYKEIKSIKQIALAIFKDSEELKSLLDENNSIETRIESICRLLLLGRFSVLTDSFEKIINDKEITGQKVKKLEFFFKAYILDLLGYTDDIKETTIVFGSWLKLIEKVNNNDFSKFKNNLLEFLIDFSKIYKNNKESIAIFEKLIDDLKKEYNEIADTISQILEYLQNPDGRESQKNMADPLFAEIIKRI